LNHQGLLDQPNETSVFAWEDPSYIEIAEWSPLESWSSFVYEIKRIKYNIYKILGILNSYSGLSNVILVFYILFMTRPLRKLILQDSLIFPALSLILYCAGYSIILVESRYVWISNILLLFMGAHLVNKIYLHKDFNNLRKAMLILFLSGFFVIGPVKSLKNNINKQKDVYLLSQELKRNFGVNGNIAANKHNTTLYISYHLGARYYGQTSRDTIEDELIAQLREKNINYYFVWGETDCSSNAVSTDYQEITNGVVPDLQIYSIKSIK